MITTPEIGIAIGLATLSAGLILKRTKLVRQCPVTALKQFANKLRTPLKLQHREHNINTNKTPATLASLVGNSEPAQDRPIAMSNPDNAEFLRGLQGNILQGHGRDHASHILVRFKAGTAQEARRWVSDFASKHVTNAYEQYEKARHFKDSAIDGGVFGHVALSSDGYRALGISDDAQPHGLNPRGHQDGKGYAEVFRKGQKARQKELHDPNVSDWDAAYQNEIHMLVILASNDFDALTLAELEVVDSLAGIADMASPERGMGLTKLLDPSKPETKVHLEHFGFVDGRSLPLMTEEEVDREKKNGGIDEYDPTAPLNLVLAPDPQAPGNYGSFLVYRKLEQNVRGFNEAITRLATALSISEDLARAMVMGRFQDGTPVAIRGTNGTTDVFNNFDYDDDAKGQRCPFQAHTRKSNPRRTGKIDDHKHRIARRAIPYGGELTTTTKLEEMPTEGKGLLFLCYQADIFEQFEFIQRTWSNFKHFPRPDSGVDPVTGQEGDASGAERAKNWPSGWNKPLTCPGVTIAGYVRMKGGEYFFSPSVEFLKNLAK